MFQAAVPQRLARVRTHLRDGTWLTAERRRAYPRMILVMLALAIVGVLITSQGGKDFAGRPLGVDFSGQWVAGTEVRAGHPAQPYDNAAHAAQQQAVFGPSDSYLPWNYPPVTLGLAGALAGLPYLPALAVWMASTFLFYLAAVRRACRRTDVATSTVLIAASAFPAVAINLLHGQNGFLSAGLMTFGAFCLHRRPLLGGSLLALLVYKPQFLLVVPIVLVAGGFRRAGAAFVVTLGVLVLVSIAAFGLAPWYGFVEGLRFSRTVILEGGGLESYKLQSAFAAVRLLGGSVREAYVIQAGTSLCVIASLAALWRSQNDLSVKVAGLLIASLLATPYAVDYDMVLIGPALAALLTDRLTTGFRPYEKTLLAIVWLVPLVARIGAYASHLPLGFIAMSLLYAAVVRPLWARRAAPEPAPTWGHVNPAKSISKNL